MQKRQSSRLIKLSLTGVLFGISQTVLASGFQLFEANGAGTGDFYADAAAGALDASTAYFNPAGLVRITHPQVVLSGVNIFSNIKFQGQDTWQNQYTRSGSAQGGGYSLVPGFDYAAPINDEFYFGLSEAIPFGLDTDYGTNSFLRYSATNTSIQVVDLSPSIGFKVTDKFSLGVGIDADRLDAEFDAMAGLPVVSTVYDTQSKNEASGWGYGWHAGALYQFTPCTRVGLSYRSKTSFSVNGTSHFQGALAGGPTSVLVAPVSSQYTNDSLSADVTLPASTMLGIYHQLNSAWALMGTVTYTEWGVFNSLSFQNVAAVNAMLGPDTITVNVPQGFRNTWRIAGGVSYQPTKDWILRAGLGYDQTPTEDNYRNVRLPDGNRTAASLGAHYQVTKNVGVDAGWTHLFIQDGEVNVANNLGSQTTYTQGTAQSHADVVGLQLTWDIV
jgi:long-chain fatty acid transport protein